MRVEISLNSISEEGVFDFSYNKVIQGFIYRNLSESIAEEIHNRGFEGGSRVFRLFTFSRILGNYKIKENKLYFKSPFKIIISSIHNEMLNDFVSNIIKKEFLIFGENKVTIDSISVKFKPDFSDDKPVKIKMLSPVTVYSTLLTKNGGKKTYYYSPFEDEFSKLIKENLIKKYVAFYKETPNIKDFYIKPIKVEKKDQTIVKYDGFVIKGWTGIYEIFANKEILDIAYECGIGSKNSQGFGCIEVNT